MNYYAIILCLFMSGAVLGQSTLETKIPTIGQNKFNKIVREEGYDQAISYGKNMLEQYKYKKDKHFVKLSVPYYTGLGKIYRSQGKYSLAEQTYLEGKKLSEQKQTAKSKEKMGPADLDLMDALADMQLETGNFRSAGSLLKQSIDQREKTMSKKNLQRYRPYLFYAKYLITTGQNEEAYQYLKDYILYIKNTYHTTYDDLDRFAEAYETLTRLELERGDLTQAFYYAEKNYKYQAHKWVRQTAGLNNLNRIESCNLMAKCWMFDADFAQAMTYSDMALSQYNSAIGTETIYKVSVLMVRAEIYWNQQEYDKAFEAFREANRIQLKFANETFGMLSEYEKENFANKLKENTNLFFAFAADALSKNVDFNTDLLNEIYFVQINSKAKILDESNRLYLSISKTKDSALKALFDNWIKLKNEYARLISTGTSLENADKIAGLEKSIDEADKQIAKSVGGNSTNSLVQPSDIANQLASDEIAIEMIRYGRYEILPNSSVKNVSYDKGGYMAMVLNSRSTKPTVIDFADAVQLEKRMFTYYTNTKRLKIDDTLSYQSYFKPLLPALKNKKSIYFSPDGIYNLVNLSILSPTKGEYVHDQYRIVNVSNTKNLLKAKNEMAYKTASLIGRPQYNTSIKLVALEQSISDTTNRAIMDLAMPIGDLPGTEREVRAIQDILTSVDVTTDMYLHNKATEGNVKDLESKNIMHMATHGFFLNTTDKQTNPMMRSGLLLTGVSDKTKGIDDGILTAYEAALLDLKDTRLVVLSACETGLGDIKNGEGVYGLNRAFEVAGVQNILMSLWKVDDTATMQLMKHFYSQLVVTNDAVEAFNNAQVLLRKEYSHPYYWGAFKMMGR